MERIRIADPIALTPEWVEVVIPDESRHSISFNAESLGVIFWSFDNGVTSMKVVGTGKELLGNFSLRSVYFKSVADNDNLQLMVRDL